MSRRTERINHLIREEISEMLYRQIKDPRLGGMITLTHVSTSSDLRHAKVFVSIMGDEKEKQEVLQTLAAASGFLHKELRGRLTLHYIPELSFHRDDTIERGAQVLQLIERSESSSEGNQGEH